MSMDIRDEELNGEYHHDCNVLITRAVALRADNKRLREAVDLFLQTAHQWIGSAGMEALDDSPPYHHLTTLLYSAEGE